MKHPSVQDNKELSREEQLNLEIVELKKENEALKDNMNIIINNTNNTTNNTNNNNTTNNNTQTITININCHGKENMEHISPHYIEYLIGRPFTSTTELIKRIHFHPDHPENRNVKISNKKLPWAEVYDGDRWIIRKKKDVLEEMVDQGFNTVDDAYQRADLSKITEFQKSRYEDYQHQYKGKELKKQLIQDAEMVVLNGM